MLNGVTDNGYTDAVSVRYAPGNIDFLQGDTPTPEPVIY